MRKIIKNLLFIVVIVAFAVGLTACAEKPQDEKEQNGQQVQLSAPSNLKIVDDMLVWDKIEKAAYYVVDYNGNIKETYNPFYKLPKFAGKAELEFRVKAVGDGVDYRESEWTEFSYLYEKPTEALRYTLLEDGSGYEVTRKNSKFNGLEGRVVIPDYYNGLPVTRIAEEAFSLHVLVTDPADLIKISNTVTTSFRLPACLESIGKSAFSLCVAIEEIKIPDSVTSIEAVAFSGCTKLKEINIPAGITEIPGTMLASTGITSFTIPDHITSLGRVAFKDCINLVEINIPNTISVIGGSTFYGCTNLKEIVIPDSVTEIGDFAFNGCTNLEKVTFSKNLQKMERCAFRGTAWYDSQPDGYVIINDNILYSYKGECPGGLRIENLPPEIKYIAGGAFQNNQDLISVNLSNVTLIGGHIFYSCDSLTEVRLSGIEEIPRLTFFRCKNLKKVVISDSVKKIVEDTFPECYLLTDVVLPDSLMTLEERAFVACFMLTNLYYAGTQDQWEGVLSDKAYGLKIYFYSETEPILNDEGTGYDGNYWHYVDGEIVIWTKENLQ